MKDKTSINTGDHTIYPNSVRIFHNKLNRRIIGTPNNTGHLSFIYKGKCYQVHRYIYEIYHNVKLTKDQYIKHLDMNPRNNRISNLELMTKCQIAQSTRHKIGKSGLRGIYYVKDKDCYRASLCHNNTNVHLGHFETIEDANSAYINYVSK